MGKEIKYSDEARKLLKEGIDELANAVKITLGPKGRNVIMEKKFGAPQISKDGVTVAKEIEFSDHYKNTGAQLIKEVASKAGDKAGDGTTTATVLAQSILTEGLKNVTAGANPMDIKRGIDKAVIEVVKYLTAISEQVNDNYDKIKAVATISANNEKEIGDLISSAMKKISHKGVITVEEAKGTDTSIEVVEGMQFDRGYISPYFITDTEKMEGVYENPYILIHDEKITVMKDLMTILEPIVQQGRSLIVIAEDVTDEALATLVLNRLRNPSFKVAAVKAPGFGDRRKETLEDIAVLTGATVISNEKGLKMENTTLDMLGTAEKIVMDKENTTIVNGHGSSEAIENRIKNIEAQVKASDSEYDSEKLEERRAKLAGGVAVMYVGAASEVEMKEKKDRVDDALNATRAAIEEGIIPGGGVALIRSIDSLDNIKTNNKDEQLGVKIVKRSLEEPLRQIVENSGLEGAIIVQKVKEGKNSFGYNALTDNYEDLMKNGIIDPVKVTRIALENAASIAGMFITTEAVIIDEDEDEPAMPAMPAGGMGGMGGMY
ncbi:MAG: chaperonin GroEL [Bacteroidota bacterium]|nr:chaperonin GroEL [Bacteroidota bacterium]